MYAAGLHGRTGCSKWEIEGLPKLVKKLVDVLTRMHTTIDEDEDEVCPF